MSDDETWFFREHPWPLILLGPMVRRVDESSASVFVALSESAHVSLKLYEGTGASRTAVTGGTSAQVQTKALGAKLHVVLVRVTGVSL